MAKNKNEDAPVKPRESRIERLQRELREAAAAEHARHAKQVATKTDEVVRARKVRDQAQARVERLEKELAELKGKAEDLDELVHDKQDARDAVEDFIEGH